MDKYKTSQMGQALKKIYRGDITIKDGVTLAQNEISEVFNHEVTTENTPVEKDMNTGCYGDVVGKCPLCGKEIVRGKFSYGCRGFKEGCNFKVGIYICGRPISVSNIKLLLETGTTSKIQGFVSKKSGKTFDGRLKLENGEAKFDFSQ